MTIKSIFVVEVLHTEPIKNLCDLIGNRVWSIDGVENTSSKEAVHVTDITSNLSLIAAIEAEADFKK